MQIICNFDVSAHPARVYPRRIHLDASACGWCSDSKSIVTSHEFVNVISADATIARIKENLNIFILCDSCIGCPPIRSKYTVHTRLNLLKCYKREWTAPLLSLLIALVCWTQQANFINRIISLHACEWVCVWLGALESSVMPYNVFCNLNLTIWRCRIFIRAYRRTYAMLMNLRVDPSLPVSSVLHCYFWIIYSARQNKNEISMTLSYVAHSNLLISVLFFFSTISVD